MPETLPHEELLRHILAVEEAARGLVSPPKPGEEVLRAPPGDAGSGAQLSAAPDVTVCMPTYGHAEFIGMAIASVLLQEGVNLELIVVDDASGDGTLETVSAIPDPRIRLIRNPRRMGIGHCHNAALAASRSDTIVHVDSDDLVLPGALVPVLDALHESPRIGQVYTDFVHLDAKARITPDDLRRQERAFSRAREGLGETRRALLVHGMMAGTLRTYRKSALEEVGPFDERLAYGVDYEMAVRLAERYEIRRVPRLLYCHRVHGRNTQATLRLRPLRLWWNRVTICRRLLLRQGGQVLGRGPVKLGGLLMLSLLHTLEVPRAAKELARATGLTRLLGRTGNRAE